MKRATLFLAVGLSAACASSAALAHADIGVFLGVPGPVYVAPPPVVCRTILGQWLGVQIRGRQRVGASGACDCHVSE